MLDISKDLVLLPYKDVRYHLKEFGSQSPTILKEFLNLRHSSARPLLRVCLVPLRFTLKFSHLGLFPLLRYKQNLYWHVVPYIITSSMVAKMTLFPLRKFAYHNGLRKPPLRNNEKRHKNGLLIVIRLQLKCGPTSSYILDNYDKLRNHVFFYCFLIVWYLCSAYLFFYLH